MPAHSSLDSPTSPKAHQVGTGRCEAAETVGFFMERRMEVAGGYGPRDPTCGGTKHGPVAAQSKTDRDISQDSK